MFVDSTHSQDESVRTLTNARSEIILAGALQSGPGQLPDDAQKKIQPCNEAIFSFTENYPPKGHDNHLEWSNAQKRI